MCSPRPFSRPPHCSRRCEIVLSFSLQIMITFIRLLLLLLLLSSLSLLLLLLLCLLLFDASWSRLQLTLADQSTLYRGWCIRHYRFNDTCLNSSSSPSLWELTPETKGSQGKYPYPKQMMKYIHTTVLVQLKNMKKKKQKKKNNTKQKIKKKSLQHPVFPGGHPSKY